MGTMAKYVNKVMAKHIPEKSIIESILDIHPIPKNLRQSSPLDDFLKELLEDSRKQKELNWDLFFLKNFACRHSLHAYNKIKRYITLYRR